MLYVGGYKENGLMLRTPTGILYCNISRKQLKRYAGTVVLLVFAQEIVQATEDLRIQQLEMKYLEVYARQHGTCVFFLQKNAEIKKITRRPTRVFPSS